MLVEKVVNELNPNDWVSNYADYLYNIAIYKLNDGALAQDLVQDTFLSALKAKEGFRGQASEKTWLTVILNNKITDQYRKKGNKTSIEEYLETTYESFNNSFFDSDPDSFGHTRQEMLASDWGYNADKKISDKEFLKILEGCVSTIPNKIAGVFLAKYMEEKKADEICNEFNITSSNYWVLVHRAKLLLRKCLEKNWFIN